MIVHSSSHRTPSNMSRDVLIFGDILFCLAYLVRPGSLSDTKYDDSIVLPYDSLAVVLFDIMTGGIIGVASLAIWMFAPESSISSVYFL